MSAPIVTACVKLPAGIEDGSDGDAQHDLPAIFADDFILVLKGLPGPQGCIHPRSVALVPAVPSGEHAGVLPDQLLPGAAVTVRHPLVAVDDFVLFGARDLGNDEEARRHIECVVAQRELLP